MNGWKHGDRVEIADGEHAGKLGTITYIYSGGTIAVLLDGHSRSDNFAWNQLRPPSQMELL